MKSARLVTTLSLFYALKFAWLNQSDIQALTSHFWLVMNADFFHSKYFAVL
uniref:Uncharacterized protein n=1 Tax=Anguilla anguilla TaxID=7936 RepID=A0A0E9SEP6_ANGAN